ncbi:rod shape-determining protein MreD [candidate division WOR-3 bacterium]|nr:rod shape-determining protein MreD [candidate division WOR-3 bacterium]
MRNFLFILLAISFCLIQSTAIRYISIGNATPDLILILLCYIALFHGRVAIWYGFGMGWFVDLYSIKGFGYNILIKTLIGGLLGYFSNYLYKGRVLSHLIILFFTAWIHDLIIALARGELSFFRFYSRIIPSSIYTTLVGVFLFLFFQKIDRKWGD